MFTLLTLEVTYFQHPIAMTIYIYRGGAIGYLVTIPNSLSCKHKFVFNLFCPLWCNSRYDVTDSALHSPSPGEPALRTTPGDQRGLDTRHRTRDYFTFQWLLIDFCVYETGVDHTK